MLAGGSGVIRRKRCAALPPGSRECGTIVLGAFGGVQYPEGIAAVRPDKQQCIFTLGHLRQGLLHITGRLDFVAIDFEDDVSPLQSSIVCRASRLHLLDYSSVDFTRGLKLVPRFRRQVAETDTPAHFPVIFAGCSVAVILVT